MSSPASSPPPRRKTRSQHAVSSPPAGVRRTRASARITMGGLTRETSDPESSLRKPRKSAPALAPSAAGGDASSQPRTPTMRAMQLSDAREGRDAQDAVTRQRPPPEPAAEPARQAELGSASQVRTPSRQTPSRRRVRMSLSRDARAQTLARRLHRLGEMANECLDAILTASTADAADNTEVVEDGAADKAWEALSSTMHAILPTVEGPFVTPEEVVDALGDEGDDVPLEQIEDVVHRLVAAAFTYTIFRPDLAFKLAGTGSDAKGKGSEDLRSRVQSRNTALELAWTRFWSIVPTELEGKDVALTQWLNFATIIHTTYCCPTIDPPSVPNGKLPSPEDFGHYVKSRDLPKGRKLWNSMSRERKRELANYDGEGLFLPYSDFREEMLAFIDVYIYPGPDDNGDEDEDEYEAAQPESEQQELMSPYDGAQELATPSNAPSPDLGDMSLHFDMDLFAQITAQMETEQDGHSNVDDDEEADVLGDLLSESQFRPRASQSQNHSQYALGESLMPSETQFNPPDPDDFEDETEMRVNGQVLNYEDQDEETLGGAFPSESQFAPRDDHYDDDSAYDDEMAEASLLPPDEQFAPSNQGDWGDDDGQQHQESTNRRPNSFSQPLFAPGASSRGESSVRDDTEVKQEGDLPYPRWLYVRTEDPEEMRQRYPGVKFLFEVKNESDVEDEGARQVVAGGEEGEWDDEEGDDNENGDEDENLEEEAALPAESQFAPIPEEEVLPTEDQFATQPDEEDDGEGVEDSPQPAEDSDEDLEDHVDPDTLLADEDWEGIGEGNQKVPAEDDVDAENPVESAENEGEAPESAAATQRASQSPSTVDPAPAPTAAAAVATASTPALGHPETRIAFNKITRRRTLEGHQFATPSPGPDDERDEEEVEQTPHSQKRVTGPRIEPSPRSQPPSQKVPSSRPTRAEEDQENRPMGAPPQPDDDEVLVEIDMNQPNGPPSPRAQAPGAEAPGAEHNGEENPLMAVQQPSQQDTVRPDPFLVDVNGRPLVTNYNMVLPADYQKRRSHLFGKIGHGPSQYVRLAGKLKWSKDDVLFLYREVQKVPMSAEHPCTVIEYLYGEYGRRSLRLRNYSAQHMKDRMRVTVMARINQLLPVHGRARHFLPNSHPDKVAYTAELAEVQGRVAAQRQAELDREGEQLGEEEEREAERDKQRKRLRERERREQEREREREEEQARRERVMEMVGRRTRKRDRTREASETDMDDTPRRRKRPAASVTPSAAIESEPEFDDFNPEVEDEPELDDEPEYESEPEPEPEPRNERDTREDLPNVHIDDFPPPETDSETEAADAAATGARRRLSAMGLGSASRPASSSGRRVRYSEQVVVEIPTPVRATHRVAQRLSQRAAQRPAPRSTPRPSQRPAKKAISDIDGDQPRPAKRLRRVEREPEPESEHEVESERERESDREPESEREREPELEPTPESSLLPASQLSPQRSTQPSPPSQLSQSVPQSSPYRASRPFQKTFARRGGARGGGASRGRPPPAQVRSTRTASYDDEEDEDMDRARPLQAAKSTVGSIPENNADDEVGVKRERESGDERLAVPGSDLGDGATDDEAPQNHGYSQYTPANTEGDDKEVGEEGEETQAATIVRRAWLMRRVELGH